MRNHLAGFFLVALALLGLCRSAEAQDYEKVLKETGLTLTEAIAKGMKEAGGVAVAAELEVEGGKVIFTTDIAVGTKVAEVNLDAKTGAVVEKATEDEDKSKIVAAAKITLAQAVEAALKKAPGKAVKADLELKGDKAVVFVRVFGDGKLVDVVVDGVTGETMAPTAAKAEEEQNEEHGFTESFGEDFRDLGPTGMNPFFVLDPGWIIELKGGEGAKETVITITVLDDTKKIAGVETRAVEEKETVGGQVKEITRDYFAISKRTNNVYYFGEDVDEYKDGKVVGHGGAWLAGEKGARYGLYMPGVPLVGSRYMQEIAPGVAMDRCEILKIGEKIETPAGKLENILVTKESSAIEKDSETKHHALGIGVVQDGGCKLVWFGKKRK